MTRAWRIIKRRHAHAAFTGEGARLFGGRWNARGTSVIYTADTAALAALEILVHVEDNAALDNYVAFRLDLPDDLVETLPTSALPDDWKAHPAPASTRALGDAWIASRRSLALRVPSVIVPGDVILLNPAHPLFARMRIPEPEAFIFDPRLQP